MLSAARIFFLFFLFLSVGAIAQNPTEARRTGERAFTNGRWAEAEARLAEYQKAKPGDLAVLSKLGIALFGVAFVMSQILFTAEQCFVFCNRYQLLSNTCEEYRKEGKFKVIGTYHPDRWQSAWALPYESMAVSALAG